MGCPYFCLATRLSRGLLMGFRLMGLLMLLAPCAAAFEFRPITTSNGVFRWPDGSEVALWGTNYYPMSWYQYESMKLMGANFPMEVKRDVADMKAMGVEVIRVHFFESECVDGVGNLISNAHLTVFDQLVAECNDQGVYLYLTLMAWWYSPGQRADAFTRQVTKMGMMYRPESIVAQKQFITQLLNHVNPLTGRKLKDEPCLAVFELLNEPFYWSYEETLSGNWPADKPQGVSDAIIQADYALWKSMWDDYKALHTISGNGTKINYNDFLYEVERDWINELVPAIRATGATQPISAALFYTLEWALNPGVPDLWGAVLAIRDSAVDAVTTGAYPGGLNEFNEDKNNLYWAGNDSLPAVLDGKARMIYEFDCAGTYNNVALYPALARRFRSMGIQIACQFTYDAAINGGYNTDWGTHYINYRLTPAKAVAFRAARDAFHAMPRKCDYSPYAADDQVWEKNAVSVANMQVLRVDERTVMHAQSIGAWAPLTLPASPTTIVGRGNSPWIEYAGSGLYELTTQDWANMTLVTTENAVPLGTIDLAWFNNVSFNTKKVRLNANPERFRLKLPTWKQFRVFDDQSTALDVASDGSFTVTPGKRYRIQRIKTATHLPLNTFE